MAASQADLEALLAALEPSIAAAFRAAVADVRNAVNLDVLIEALARGDLVAAMAALQLNAAFFAPLGEAIAGAYVRAGREALAMFPRIYQPGIGEVVLRFDTGAPRAQRWVARHGSLRITEITEDARAGARAFMEQGLASGRGPRDMALDVVGRVNRATGAREGGVIGLRSDQMDAVRRAREELASGDPAKMRAYKRRELRDKRFDYRIDKAIKDGKSIPAKQIEQMATRYSARLLKHRGDTIARTEALASLNAAQYEGLMQSVDGGVVTADRIKREWRSAMDGRVRDSHARMNGTKVGLYERFPNGLMHPGDPNGLAGETVNCLPPWSVVALAGLRGAMTRQYRGDLVELAFGGVVDFAVTPNHPVLTARGWIAAGEIVEGDDLVHAPRRDQRRPLGELDVADGEARAHQLYDAAQATADVMRVGRVIVDLHGEAPDEDVDVVAFDRSLRDAWEPASVELFGQIDLAETDIPPAFGGGAGAKVGRCGGLTDTASRVMRGSDTGAADVLAHVSRGAAVSFGYGGTLDAEVAEACVHDLAATAQAVSDGVDGVAVIEQPANVGGEGVPRGAEGLRAGEALACKLAARGFRFVRVQKVRRRHYEGPVFNFESATGLLCSDGIVNHNCRCVVLTRVSIAPRAA